MPVEGQEMLKWASLIGNNFSFQMISQLMAADDCKENMDNIESEHLSDSDDEGSSTDSMSRSSLGLQYALEHGFIHASGLDAYTFAHKRYLRAAATMIDEEQKAKMRSRIAQRYATESSLDVFWVANHLLGAFRIINKLEKKSIYRKILVQAMDKANANGVQDMALAYCKSAIALLAPSPWVDGEDSNYDETLHIYHNLSQLHCFFAHKDDSRAAADEIINNARNGIDRSRAYKVIYLHLYAAKQYEESIKLLEISIDDLGLIKVARQPQKEQVDESYNRLEHEILQLGVDNILNLEPSQDPILHATMANMEQLYV
jgi:predicted ATPase